MKKSKLKHSLTAGVRQAAPPYFVMLLLLTLLLLSLPAAVTLGSAPIPPGEIYRVIWYHLTESILGAGKGLGDAARYGQGSLSDIVWFVRLPRLVLAIGVGSCLSVSGAVMQAVVRNPMADPYVLGISSGACLGAILAIVFGLGAVFGSAAVGSLAFIGAFVISLSVVALANLGGKANSVKLVLAGTAVAAICSAVSSFLLYVINTSSGAVESVMRWMLGSLAAATWENNLMILPVALIGLLFFWSQYRALNLMLLGDEAAMTLGMSLKNRRTMYLLVASLLVGFAVYSAGILGFVGLVIPHMVRLLFGNEHKFLLPLTSLLGSIFLLWADVLCRVIIPRTELPIGILTSLIGAPLFIILMAKSSYSFGVD